MSCYLKRLSNVSLAYWCPCLYEVPCVTFNDFHIVTWIFVSYSTWHIFHIYSTCTRFAFSTFSGRKEGTSLPLVPVLNSRFVLDTFLPLVKVFLNIREVITNKSMLYTETRANSSGVDQTTIHFANVVHYNLSEPMETCRNMHGNNQGTYRSE